MVLKPSTARPRVGWDFKLSGKVFLIKKKIKKVSRVQLKVSSPIKKAFLIWSGEVKEHNKNSGKIHFLGPKSKEHRITAQHLWEKNSTGILYSAIADVTDYVAGSGLYGVKKPGFGCGESRREGPLFGCWMGFGGRD